MGWVVKRRHRQFGYPRAGLFFILSNLLHSVLYAFEELSLDLLPLMRTVARTNCKCTSSRTARRRSPFWMKKLRGCESRRRARNNVIAENESYSRAAFTQSRTLGHLDSHEGRTIRQKAGSSKPIIHHTTIRKSNAAACAVSVGSQKEQSALLKI